MEMLLFIAVVVMGYCFRSQIMAFAKQMYAKLKGNPPAPPAA